MPLPLTASPVDSAPLPPQQPTMTTLLLHAKRSRASNETMLAHYELELKTAQQMGDLEGERHVHRMLAFRSNVFGDAVNEAIHKREVDNIERVCGKIRNTVMDTHTHI